jgi:hypothetical protein
MPGPARRYEDRRVFFAFWSALALVAVLAGLLFRWMLSGLQGV